MLRPKILIIGNDNDVIRMFEMYFNKEGFSSRYISFGISQNAEPQITIDEVIVAIEQFQPDVILWEVRMSREYPQNLLEQLHSHVNLEEISIIYQSMPNLPSWITLREIDAEIIGPFPVSKIKQTALELINRGKN